jgi:anti-repressor protein
MTDKAPALVDTRFDGYHIRFLIPPTGEPAWVGKDVCAVLGISKYRDAQAQLDTDERVSIAVDTPGGPQRMVGVLEAGLYALMIISRSPQAQSFRRWLDS